LLKPQITADFTEDFNGFILVMLCPNEVVLNFYSLYCELNDIHLGSSTQGTCFVKISAERIRPAAI